MLGFRDDGDKCAQGWRCCSEVASPSASYVVSAAAFLEGENVPAVELLERAMTFSSRQIFQDASNRPERHRMATTATAILTHGTTFALAHVGDCAPTATGPAV